MPRKALGVKALFSTVLILGLSIVTQQAVAGFSCTGQVRTLGISPSSGLLSVDAGYGVHYLCNLTTAMNGVDPTTCKAWYAMFLTAKSSGKTVSLHYDPSAGGATNCESLGSWVAPNPQPYFANID